VEIRKIILPLDCKQESRFSLEYAVNFARAYRAKLYVVSVVHEYNVIQALANLFYQFGRVFHPGADLEFPPVDIQEDACHQVKCQVESMLRRYVPQDVAYEVLIRVGDAAEEIVSCARELEADVIIIFTHGRTGLDRALLGSVTEKVLAEAPCPVLSIKHPEHEFIR